MNLLQEIRFLIAKEILMEWRQKYAFYGILLYVTSTVYVSYSAFKIVSPLAWIALFWIILLFASVNAVARSFIQEPRGRMLYFYTLVSPQAIILSKIIYNILLLFLISGICLLFYSLFIGNPIQDLALFILGIFLGSLGLAISLTMVSAISYKANNNSTLMAILSFPILIPILGMVIKLSKNALDGLTWSASKDEIITLLALDFIVVILAYLLFPFLWRE